MSSALILTLLSLGSFTAWFISLLTGGGSPIILIPLVTLLLGAQSVAPVITIGGVLCNVQRSTMLWRHIDWALMRWQIPGILTGSVLGAYAFTRVQVEGLQIFIAIALLYMMVHSLLRDRINLPFFAIKTWHFLPLSFFNSLVSGLIGGTGPIMNPAYLNYGLQKEQMVATRAAVFTLTHLIKILAYAALGALSPDLIGYGLLMGLSALPANWLGTKVLEKMSPAQFQIAVVSFLGVSGMWMLWQQRALLLAH
jgi:uncharacterized protein